MLPAALVLAIMVLPTISAISRDALVAVPPKLREAAFGLGATRWEAILAVIVPTAATGIFGSIILGFGRALGETMALAMLAGNANVISWSLFSPANTLAALLANHFPEAGTVEVGALMYAALVLLAITLVVNVVGTADRAAGRRGAEGAAMITPAPIRGRLRARSTWRSLERSLRRPRALFSCAMSVITGAVTIVALVPLFSVLYMLVTRGGKQLGAGAVHRAAAGRVACRAAASATPSSARW